LGDGAWTVILLLVPLIGKRVLGSDEFWIKEQYPDFGLSCPCGELAPVILPKTTESKTDDVDSFTRNFQASIVLVLNRNGSMLKHPDQAKLAVDFPEVDFILGQPDAEKEHTPGHRCGNERRANGDFDSASQDYQQ